MINFIELNNISVETFKSKCTTPSKTEREGEVKVKFYGKWMGKSFQMYCFSMMQPYNVNLRYSKVVEVKTAYLLVEDHFKIKAIIIKNVLQCIKNEWDQFLN